MSDTDASEHRGVLNIPLAISAQTVNYNIPGVSTLKLDGPALAGIYSGTIRRWDDEREADQSDQVAVWTGSRLP